MWGCWSEIGGSYIYTRVPQNLDFRLVLKGGARVAVPLIGHNSADGFRAGADARNGSKGGPSATGHQVTPARLRLDRALRGEGPPA